MEVARVTAQTTRLMVDSAMPNGIEALRRMVERAGYASVLEAVAEHVVFLHPNTVGQTGLKPIFPVVRDMKRRCQTEVLANGQEVMYDDNTMPTFAFRWAAGWPSTSTDLQFNHVITDSSDVRHYTALWNLCVTPAFLAKATDGHPEVATALRYRSHELYGSAPHLAAPEKPEGYEQLRWGPVAPPISDLASTMQARFSKSNSTRAKAIRRIGWLFGPPTPP